jgi:hypothetical protein
VSVADVGTTAAMRVRVTDESLAGDLEAFLTTTECRARKVGNVTFDVTMRAPSSSQGRRELEIYLRTWEAMHPGAHARLVSQQA